MNIVERKLTEITPYGHNPRRNENAIPLVANSIKEFGFKQPIVIDKDGIIVAGHTRYEAAKRLKMKTVPCVIADDLSDEQVKAYRLADNKVSELAEWDFELLDTELSEILDIDMEDFGFVEFEMPEYDEVEKDVKEDEYEEKIPKTANTKLGDIYELGNHRLMCGDSTSADDVSELFGGGRADICFTSPPYNASHLDIPLSDERGGGTQKSTQQKYLNDDDKQSDDEYFEFLRENIDILLKYSNEVFYNLGVASGSKTAIAELLHHYSDKFKDLIYWQKDNPVPVIQENVISSATELIIALGENNSRGFKHFNDRMFHGVINGHSASGNKYSDIHKATFPIYLPSDIISRFTKKGGTVFDCFGGTGTTMIACEQLDRKCYMMELEPIYCDVIIDRWEQFTGQKAKLISHR